MPAVRTFIAVDLTPEVKAQIGQIIGRLRPLSPSVRWVRSQGLHLTLKFLGELPQERLPAVYRAVERAATGIQPFSFVLAGVGGFPNLRRPRVIWIGLQAGEEPLKVLQNQVENQLAECGFLREGREFSPHLTIGRVKSPHGLKPLLDELCVTSYTSDEIPVTAVKVMRSQLKPSGAEYSALQVVPLE